MSQNSTPDAHGAAIAFLLFGIMGGLALDVVAKWLLADYSLQQFVFLRSVLARLFFCR